MPSRKPYGCVFCPTHSLAFFFFVAFLRNAAFLAFARGFAFAFASAFASGAAFAAGAGAPGGGAPTPATRISTWLVRFRIAVRRPRPAPRHALRAGPPPPPPQA